MKDALTSHSFLTHLVGLLSLLGANAAMPNTPALSIAIAVITGVTQATHAYAKVRTQSTVSPMDAGICLPPPALTNASGDVPVAAP